MTVARLTRRTMLGAALILSLAGAARPLEPVTYLLPAPKEAIVFAPLVLADREGDYRRAGLDVRFEVVPGGVKVGEALASGKGMLGGAVGDTAMVLRARGLPVQAVMLFGEHSFLTLMTRQRLTLDAAGLRGATIGVPSFQDTSYYAAKALLRAHGLADADVTVRAAPPAELIGAMGRGEMQAIIGTVDWGVKVERARVALDYRPLDPFYPALAQAILVSDATAARQPRAVRAFVHATAAAMRRMIRDPDGAAWRYAAAVPGSEYSHAEIARIFRLLARDVYGKNPNRFQPARMEAAARAAGAAPTNSYTNAFVGR